MVSDGLIVEVIDELKGIREDLDDIYKKLEAIDTSIPSEPVDVDLDEVVEELRAIRKAIEKKP